MKLQNNTYKEKINNMIKLMDEIARFFLQNIKYCRQKFRKKLRASKIKKTQDPNKTMEKLKDDRLKHV